MIWAVVPVKELEGAKQRLRPALTPTQRLALAQLMLTECHVASPRGNSLKVV